MRGLILKKSQTLTSKEHERIEILVRKTIRVDCDLENVVSMVLIIKGNLQSSQKILGTLCSKCVLP